MSQEKLMLQIHTTYCCSLFFLYVLVKILPDVKSSLKWLRQSE